MPATAQLVDGRPISMRCLAAQAAWVRYVAPALMLSLVARAKADLSSALAATHRTQVSNHSSSSSRSRESSPCPLISRS